MRAQSWDMAALGVGVVAGGAAGVWPLDSFRTHATQADTFLPTTTDDGNLHYII